MTDSDRQLPEGVSTAPQNDTPKRSRTESISAAFGSLKPPSTTSSTLRPPNTTSMTTPHTSSIKPAGTGSTNRSGRRRLSIFSNFSQEAVEAPIDENRLDWHMVLKNLQREKKRFEARKAQQYVNKSLFCLESNSTIREWFINVAEWPWFNRLVLIAILSNCVFLILEDPICRCNDPVCKQWEIYERLLYAGVDCSYWPETKKVLDVSEVTFTALFTLEMVIKIVARGFIIHKHAYLRDSWNWIDFIVVVASWGSLTSVGGNVQVLRTVRVLRPLRTMTRITGMRPLINTFVGSFKNLGNVGSLLMFFFVVYGILGIDLLGGALRGRCYIDPLNNNFTKAVLSRLQSQQIPFIAEPGNTVGTRFGGVTLCSMSTTGTFHGAGCDLFAIDGVWYNTTCSQKRWCGKDWCVNVWNDNPFDLGGGYINYDNIGEAFLAIFQTLTNEGWVDLLYRYQDGYQVWGSRLFHSTWVIVGSFFVIQLALAVLADSFVQAQEDVKTEKEREALHDQAILRPAGDENQDNQMGLMSYVASLSKNDSSNTPMHRKALHHAFGREKAEKVFAFLGHKIRMVRTACRQVVTTKTFQNLIICAIIANTIIMAYDKHDQVLFEREICKRRCELDPNIPAAATSKCTGPLYNTTFESDKQGGGIRPQQVAFCFMEDDDDVPFESSSLYHGASCSQYETESSCISAVLNSSVSRCYWFPDKQWSAREPGRCMLPLYNSSSFAETAEIDYDGRVAKISLRHICGDFLELCATFPANERKLLDDINLALTSVFIIEMALKWVGLGLREYFSARFNQFDFVVVVTSIYELIYNSRASTGSSSASSVSALRGMRLFRLFKLARSWKSMRKILNTLAVALGNLGPLTIVWLMFMYIFGLLAMQFFGGTFHFVKSNTPRSNFDSFFPSPSGHGAFWTIFQIITTENWNTVMYNCITATEPNQPLASLLTIAVVAFGNYIIMNLFISILLQGFDEEDNDEGDSNKTPLGGGAKMMAGFKRLLGQQPKTQVSSHGEATLTQGLGFIRSNYLRKMVERSNPLPSWEDTNPRLDSGADDAGYCKVLFAPFKRTVRIPDHRAFFILAKGNPFRIMVSAVVQHPVFENTILLCILITSLTILIERPDDSIIATSCPMAPAILNCTGLSPGHIDQVNCPRSAYEDDFGRVWDACGSPNKDNVPACCAVAARLEIFKYMDKVFTLIFLAEMVLKLISDGMVLHDHAYMRNPWNWLDLSIVVISMLSSFGEQTNLKSLKALRAMRALRPLRVIKRNPGLKIAVVCLLSSVPFMMNVVVVVFVWFSMYAMLGVQFFKGKLYTCYDYTNQIWYGTPWFPTSSIYLATPQMGGKQAVPTIIECVSAGSEGGVGAWVDRPYTFNDYPRALLTLFEMSTTEGWMDVMAACVDGLAPGVTGIPNANPVLSALYCACHIVIGAFILLNLIVGSVINNYNRIKSENDGKAPYLTPEQQEWIETQKIIFHLEPQERKNIPKNFVRRICFRLVHSALFKATITTCIVLNVATMAMKTHDQSDCWMTAIFWTNVVFNIFFVMEILVKILGLGPRWYFFDPWNCFDFLVVSLSLLTLAFDALNDAWFCDRAGIKTRMDLPGFSILRVFRVARVFRLVRRLKGLTNMIETLIISLPLLVNIGSLLALILIIFSVLGVTFFYNVNQNQDVRGYMSNNANYAYFDYAMWTLHRQTTGEAWNGFMYYCSQDDSYKGCQKAYGPYLGDGCGGSVLGILFHVLWQLFGTYVLMQLFTAVILENFHDTAKGNTSVLRLPYHKLKEFADVWSELDPNATRKIHVNDLPALITQLSPPLGVKDKIISSSTLLQVIKDLAIPIRKGEVTYKETFVSCVKRCMDEGFEEFELDSRLQMDNNFEHLSTSVKIKGRPITVAEDYAARSVQRAYREYRERRLQVLKGLKKTCNIPLEGTPMVREFAVL